jgi:preprotein translocase subunit SecD
MKILVQLAVIAFSAGLVGCQTSIPQPEAKPFTSGNSVGTRGTASGDAPLLPAAQTRRQATIITLHLAQERSESGLVAVDVGGASLYALPQPVLTQADIARVSPVIERDQGTMILLEMNQHGIVKLQKVTEQALGHQLLLSVRGQLVNVATIGEVIKDGRLAIRTRNAAHSNAIINMMKPI